MEVRERNPRTSFPGKLVVAPWAWWIDRSIASLSGRPVVWYRCGHRYGLYRRESLWLSVTWLLLFGLTPKIPSKSAHDKILQPIVARTVNAHFYHWLRMNASIPELLAMVPRLAGMQRRCTTSRIRHHRDRHRKLSLSSSAAAAAAAAAVPEARVRVEVV